VEGCCEHGDGPSGATNGVGLFIEMSSYQLLK